MKTPHPIVNVTAIYLIDFIISILLNNYFLQAAATPSARSFPQLG